jgi:hypothetical protein
MFSSRVLQKIKRKFGLTYKNNARYEMLMSLKTYAKDKIHSQDIKSFDMYDFKKIEGLVNGFYDGKNMKLSGSLEWWITFEIWRESLTKK